MFSSTKKGFLLTVKRQQQILPNLLGVVSDSVSLVFPRNDKFIRELRERDVPIFVKHGWDIENTLFFEIPYVMSFSYNLEPALVASYVLDVVPQKSYFKCLVFTKGYISNAHRLELDDTVLHEKMHLIEFEREFRIGNIRAADPTLKKEKVVSEIVEKTIRDKYGSLFEQVKVESTLFSLHLQSKRHTIISGILEFWLWKYLHRNYRKYAEFSYPIPSSMQSELEKLNPKFVQKVRKIYENKFGFDIK